jgi:two-component system response regulator MprA
MPTILLVADDDWVRNDVEAALAGPGTTIQTLADPRLAVNTSHDSEPALIIVDMQVGSMGGMAVVRALKGAAGTGLIEEAPIVLLLDRGADIFLGKRSGADAWVQKPFSAQELRAAKDEAMAGVAG